MLSPTMPAPVHPRPILNPVPVTAAATIPNPVIPVLPIQLRNPQDRVLPVALAPRDQTPPVRVEHLPVLTQVQGQLILELALTPVLEVIPAQLILVPAEIAVLAMALPRKLLIDT